MTSSVCLSYLFYVSMVGGQRNGEDRGECSEQSGTKRQLIVLCCMWVGGGRLRTLAPPQQSACASPRTRTAGAAATRERAGTHGAGPHHGHLLCIASHVTVIETGEQALTFVRRSAPYAGAVRPDLILLDLNLPRKNGHEVLRELKSDPTLRAIPVVVLTSSEAPEDIRQSYALQANAYVVKSLELAHVLRVLKAIADFWLMVARLPSE
jgi:chemotaxis family two-component system response regulator Rcp1